MDLSALHPLPDDAAAAFLRAIAPSEHSADGNTPGAVRSQTWFQRIAGNPHPRPNDLSFGFGLWLAARQPVFAQRGLSLSSWEARIDRGAGMLLRPPSRLFGDAGLDLAIARSMPIRIEGGDPMMGGAFVPARLMGQYLDRLDLNFERSVRRLNEAELDSVEVMGLLYEAVRYAVEQETGLYETVGLLDPDDTGSWPPGVQVITQSTDKALAKRIRSATEQSKEPGLFARLLGRSR